MKKNRTKSNRRNFSKTDILSRSKIVCERLRRILFKSKLLAFPLITAAVVFSAPAVWGDDDGFILWPGDIVSMPTGLLANDITILNGNLTISGSSLVFRNTVVMHNDEIQPSVDANGNPLGKIILGNGDHCFVGTVDLYGGILRAFGESNPDGNGIGVNNVDFLDGVYVFSDGVVHVGDGSTTNFSSLDVADDGLLGVTQNAKVTIDDLFLTGGGSGLLVEGSESRLRNVAVMGYSYDYENDSLKRTTLGLFGKTEFENPDGTNSIDVIEYAQLWIAGGDINYNGTVINISDYGEVYGTVDSLQTDINIFNGGSLYLTDQISAFFNEADLPVFYTNKVYTTLDENNRPTFLEWDSTRAAVEKGQTFSNKITYSESDDYRNLNSDGSQTGGIVIRTFSKFSKEEYVAGEIASSNGYTVVFDDPESEGLFEDFGGVYHNSLGTTVLKGDTVFGNGAEKFLNYGENYEKSDLTTTDGRDLYEVKTGGVLAFYRNGLTDPNAAPVLNSYLVHFRSGDSEYTEEDKTYITDGNRLWLDTTLNDAEGNLDNSSDRLLGTINAHHIYFMKDNEGNIDTQVWYDRVSTLEDSANMTFQLNVEKTENGDLMIGIADNNQIESAWQATTEDIEAIFGQAQLVDAEFDTTTGTVTMNALNVAEYATGAKMTDDEINFANQLDQNRANVNENTDFYDALYNETDASKVTQTIHNIARGFGLSNSVYSTMQLGMAGSSFYNGLTSGGVVTRAQSGYGEKVDDPSVGNTVLGGVNRQEGAVGQENAYPSFGTPYPTSTKNRNVWGAFSHTSLDADTYEQGGITYDAYKVRRSGFLSGLRYQFDDSTSGGLLFAYSNPEMNQSGIYEGWDAGYSTDMDMDDFQLAFHLEKAFGDAWEANFFVGGGAQTLDWNRSIRDGIQNAQYYNFAGDTTGNTVTATAYLARRIDLTDRWVLRPTVGIDSEHSWLFGFNEVGLNDASGASTNLTAATQVFGYNKIQYSRNTGRVGLTSTMSGPRERAGIIGRAFYGVQLGGDDAAEVTMTSQNVAGRNYMPWETTQTGHAMGGEALSLGLSGYLFVNPEKTLTLSGDYNALVYKNATTQNATGSVQYRF